MLSATSLGSSIKIIIYNLSNPKPDSVYNLVVLSKYPQLFKYFMIKIIIFLLLSLIFYSSLNLDSDSIKIELIINLLLIYSSSFEIKKIIQKNYIITVTL